MMTLDDLQKIANEVVNLPWGLDCPDLQANSESWAPYLRFLHHVVAKYKPEVVLECGVYMATATEHMAIANRDTLVIGIDRDFHPHAYDIKARNDNIILVTGDTVDSRHIVEMLVDLHLAEIGLLFLDSTHDGETPKSEFLAYQSRFADECLVVVDDLIGPKHLADLMQVFWDWLPGEKMEMHFLHPKCTESLHDTPGFGVSIVRRS